jgi:hypothetical protein
MLGRSALILIWTELEKRSGAPMALLARQSDEGLSYAGGAFFALKAAQRGALRDRLGRLTADRSPIPAPQMRCAVGEAGGRRRRPPPARLGRTTPHHSANPSRLVGSPKPARSRSSWRRHARVPKKPSQSPIQGWMAVALQWVRLEPDVKVRSRVTADPNHRAILVQPKSDSYLDVLFVCVRTHGNLHCTAVFKAMTTCAPLSPTNRKRAGRLFQRPASSAALEGG